MKTSTQKLLNWLGAFAVLLLSLPVMAEPSKRLILRSSDLNEVESLLFGDKQARVERRLDDDRGLVVTMEKSAFLRLKAKVPSLQYEIDKKVKLIDANVVSVSAVSLVSAQNKQPKQEIPWGLVAIHAREAHQIAKGKGARVCVIDSGIQRSHPDLKGQVIAGRNFVGYNGVIIPGRFGDDNGHGTHVAGTIAALDNKIGVVGVAPQAKLIAAKVLDRDGTGFISDVADAIRFCVKKKAHIASMSLGTADDSPVLREAVYEASRAGLIMVAASGNSGGVVDYPAAYPEVLAVTAIDRNLEVATFSGTGSEVDYTAPGVEVYSTTNRNGYAIYSGTSMATPHVAGVLALAISKGQRDLATIDLGTSLQQQGHGLIDAGRTLGILK